MSNPGSISKSSPHSSTRPASTGSSPGRPHPPSSGIPSSADIAKDFLPRPACPLCGQTDPKAFALVHDFQIIPVRRCLKCGMMHSAVIMSEAATQRYYREVFGSSFHQRGQEINASVNMAALARMLPILDVRTFLDVGCGYGYLLKQLAARSIQAMGVEISASESKFAREQLKVDVKTGTLAQAAMPAGWFDVAACFEVIEHIPEPIPFIRELASHVRPGGWVVINTDNFESPIVKAMGAAFPKWIPHTHVCHFGPDTLRRAMHDAGVHHIATWSYTPWENAIRAKLKANKPAPDARTAWNFQTHLAEEMKRDYPMFHIRHALAKIYSGRISLKQNDLGSMIFVVGRVR